MMAETIVQAVKVTTAVVRGAVLGLGKAGRSVLVLALLVVLARCVKWMGARSVLKRRLRRHCRRWEDGKGRRGPPCSTWRIRASTTYKYRALPGVCHNGMKQPMIQGKILGSRHLIATIGPYQIPGILFFFVLPVGDCLCKHMFGVSPAVF